MIVRVNSVDTYQVDFKNKEMQKQGTMGTVGDR